MKAIHSVFDISTFFVAVAQQFGAREGNIFDLCIFVCLATDKINIVVPSFR
jgi:hypothetical protein